MLKVYRVSAISFLIQFCLLKCLFSVFHFEQLQDHSFRTKTLHESKQQNFVISSAKNCKDVQPNPYSLRSNSQGCVQDWSKS